LTNIHTRKLLTNNKLSSAVDDRSFNTNFSNRVKLFRSGRNSSLFGQYEALTVLEAIRTDEEYNFDLQQ